MVKLLICGDLCGPTNWKCLCERLATLQESHGPFDILFLVGKLFKDENDYLECVKVIQLTIPTYFYDRTGVPLDILYNSMHQIVPEIIEPTKYLPKNLCLLKNSTTTPNINIGISNLHGLVVGFINSSTKMNDNTKIMDEMKEITSKPLYKGCDIVLSSEWPYEIHQFIPITELDFLKENQVSISRGSTLVSDCVEMLRPRYHFAGNGDIYYQRAPYTNNIDGMISPVTRFISLATVSDSKEKSKKYLHALALEPISNLSNDDIQQKPDNTTENPYVKVSGSSGQPVAKRFKFDDSHVNTGAMFYGSNGLTHNAPSDTSRILFIGNVPRNATENVLLKALPGAKSIRKVDGKSYIFVEFNDHQSARAVYLESTSVGIMVEDRTLSVGWAKDKEPNSNNNLQLQPTDSDSKTLFMGNLCSQVSLDDIRKLFHAYTNLNIIRPEGRDYSFLEFNSHADATEVVASTQPYILGGNQLILAWAKGKPADRVLSSTHQQDCWFCLASPSIKTHLICSVGEYVYIAMPKGSVTDMHVLIAPIECVPNRLHLTAIAKDELIRYEKAINSMLRTRRLYPVAFERAIRTKCKDHMQQHIVPISYEDVKAGSFQAFLKTISSYKLSFHEITCAEQDIDTVVLTMPGGPYQEFFYISIPVLDDGKKDVVYRRFVYLHEEKSRFQMSLGNEICANIIGQPERGNWKNCTLDDESESKLTEAFIDKFGPYDPMRAEA